MVLSFTTTSSHWWMQRAGVGVAVVKNAEQITVNNPQRPLDPRALNTLPGGTLITPSRLLLKACPNRALHINVPGKWTTQPHTLQRHIVGYISTDPFKPALTPTTAKKKRCVHTCTILKLSGTTYSWESESPGFSECKMTSPAPSGDPAQHPWAELGSCPGQPLGHTRSWPSLQPRGSSSPALLPIPISAAILGVKTPNNNSKLLVLCGFITPLPILHSL